jgi:hypothetical protein
MPHEDGSLGNRDKPCFKLADFGRSHFKETPDIDGMHENNRGNRTNSESFPATSPNAKAVEVPV